MSQMLFKNFSLLDPRWTSRAAATRCWSKAN